MLAHLIDLATLPLTLWVGFNHLIEPTCETLQRLCWTDSGDLAAYHRSDLGSQQFDGLDHFVKGHAPNVDLPDEALVSKQFVLVQQFVDDLLWAS
jgi:hypothetical protein